MNRPWIGALVLALVALAERGTLDDVPRAELDVIRGRISFASERGNEAPRLLLKAARQLELHDVPRDGETEAAAVGPRPARYGPQVSPAVTSLNPLPLRA